VLTSRACHLNLPQSILILPHVVHSAQPARTFHPHRRVGRLRARNHQPLADRVGWGGNFIGVGNYDAFVVRVLGARLEATVVTKE
jgi:hypothetical protein